jgi:hypothetical protein
MVSESCGSNSSKYLPAVIVSKLGSSTPNSSGTSVFSALSASVLKLGRKNYFIKQRPASRVVVSFCAVLLFYTGMESFPAYSFCLMYIGREPLDIV